ncbi:MAG TPA: hypothetical protein VN600_07330, partial [Gemmatimonadaceae bacterium]|nr:hypothetical protein [Gemmatimonadaceae bacterium]
MVDQTRSISRAARRTAARVCERTRPGRGLGFEFTRGASMATQTLPVGTEVHDTFPINGTDYI